MKKHTLIISLAALFIACGCCAKEACSTAQKDAPSQSSKNLTESFCCNDAKKFTQCLPEKIKKEFKDKDFHEARKKLCGQMGEVAKHKYVGKLKHPMLDIDLWQITFEKKNDQGKMIQQDALFQVVSLVENGKREVLSFGFL